MRYYLSIIVLLSAVLLSGYEIGEDLTFELSYGVINAGSSNINVTQAVYQDSINCLKISSLSKTNKFFDRIFKVRDRIESIWSVDLNSTLKYTKKMQEGKYRQSRIHYYYPEQNLTVYMKKDKKAKKYKTKSFAIPDHTHDILSAFYWVRTQEMIVGDTLSTMVTVDGKSYQAGLMVLEKEVIPSIYGKVECLIIEPILQGDAIFKQTGKIQIWVTNDQHKIPLKIESKIIFGSFKAILKEVKNVTYQKE